MLKVIHALEMIQLGSRALPESFDKTEAFQMVDSQVVRCKVQSSGGYMLLASSCTTNMVEKYHLMEFKCYMCCEWEVDA